MSLNRKQINYKFIHRSSIQQKRKKKNIPINIDGSYKQHEMSKSNITRMYTVKFSQYKVQNQAKLNIVKDAYLHAW